MTTHPYRRNGLGGVDQNGNVPCADCGQPAGAHPPQISTPDGPARQEGA